MRNVFVIGPDKKVKLVLVYPMTTGRNFDEVLRVIDSLQLTAKHKVATPAQWKDGDDVIIAGSVTDERRRSSYPDGWESPQARTSASSRSRAERRAGRSLTGRARSGQPRVVREQRDLDAVVELELRQQLARRAP